MPENIREDAGARVCRTCGGLKQMPTHLVSDEYGHRTVRWHDCPACGGTGEEPKVCRTCGGRGWHGDPTEDETKCPACGGTGNIPYCPEGDPECECRSDPCPECGGTGKEESDGKHGCD